jgi:hypothetical protein
MVLTGGHATACLQLSQWLDVLSANQFVLSRTFVMHIWRCYMPEQVRASDRSNREFSRREFSRRQFLQYSAAGLSAALLSACAPTAAPSTGEAASSAASGEAPAAGEPTRGGTLRLMGHQEVAGMGPVQLGASVQQVVIYAIHNPLVLLDETLVTKGVLAESYEVAEDGLTYTFNLFEGVKFHDDADFTAQDVVYTYDCYGEYQYLRRYRFC